MMIVWLVLDRNVLYVHKLRELHVDIGCEYLGAPSGDFLLLHICSSILIVLNYSCLLKNENSNFIRYFSYFGGIA